MAEADLMEEGEIVDDSDDEGEKNNSNNNTNDAAIIASTASRTRSGELSYANNQAQCGDGHEEDGALEDDDDADDYGVDHVGANAKRRIRQSPSYAPYSPGGGGGGSENDYDDDDDEIDEDELLGTTSATMGGGGARTKVARRRTRSKRGGVKRRNSSNNNSIDEFENDFDSLSDNQQQVGLSSSSSSKRRKPQPPLAHGDNDGSSLSRHDSGGGGGGKKFMKRPCKFFLRGNCKDVYCSYPHELPSGSSRNTSRDSRDGDGRGFNGGGESALLPPSSNNSSLSSTSTTPAGSNQVDSGGAVERKFEPCKYYLLGGCWRGPSCPYMHGDFPCKFFHTGAKCHKGYKCRFSHAMPLAPEARKALFDYLGKDQAGGTGALPLPQQETTLNSLLLNNSNSSGGKLRSTTAAAVADLAAVRKRSPPPLPNAPRRILPTPTTSAVEAATPAAAISQQPEDGSATQVNTPPAPFKSASGTVISVDFPAPPAQLIQRLATFNSGNSNNSAAVAGTDPRATRVATESSSASVSGGANVPSETPQNNKTDEKAPSPQQLDMNRTKPVNFELPPAVVRALLPTPRAQVFNTVDEDEDEDDDDDDGVADGLKPPSKKNSQNVSRRSPPLANDAKMNEGQKPPSPSLQQQQGQQQRPAFPVDERLAAYDRQYHHDTAAAAAAAYGEHPTHGRGDPHFHPMPPPPLGLSNARYEEKIPPPHQHHHHNFPPPPLPLHQYTEQLPYYNNPGAAPAEEYHHRQQQFQHHHQHPNRSHHVDGFDVAQLAPPLQSQAPFPPYYHLHQQQQQLRGSEPPFGHNIEQHYDSARFAGSFPEPTLLHGRFSAADERAFYEQQQQQQLHHGAMTFPPPLSTGGRVDLMGGDGGGDAIKSVADPRRRGGGGAGFPGGGPAAAGTNFPGGVSGIPDLNTVVEALQKRLAASASAAGGTGGGNVASLLQLVHVPTLDASFEMLPEGAVAQWHLEAIDDLAANNAEYRLRAAQKFLRHSHKSPDELQCDPRLHPLLGPDEVVHAERERRLSEVDERDDEERNRLQNDMDHFSFRVLEDLQRKKQQMQAVGGALRL